MEALSRFKGKSVAPKAKEAKFSKFSRDKIKHEKPTLRDYCIVGLHYVTIV